MPTKHFCVDTNVIIENPKFLETLINGKEGKDRNEVYLPQTVIEELDKLKRDRKIKYIVSEAVTELKKFEDQLHLLPGEPAESTADNRILDEIERNSRHFPSPPILVTNDRILQFKAAKRGLEVQELKDSMPYKSESERYTGFVAPESEEEFINNCFYWQNGVLHYNKQGHAKPIDYENAVWKVKARDAYQNAALELMLDDNVDLVTIQSSHGKGKTLLSLAVALYLVLEAKKFDKIMVFKPNIEIGEKIGFLPGSAEDKMEPFFRPIRDIIMKLHSQREANKLFFDPRAPYPAFDDRVLELLPLNFIRGMNIDNTVVVIDESQNISRLEARSLLSRMGENVKCILNGDVNQIDNPHLDENNNAINWITKLFKGQKTYGHMVLRGKQGRGPIADMVLRVGL